MELAPFSPAEVGAARLGRLWERGGFPPAFLAPGDGAWRRWIENYVRTFVERDLGLLGLDLPAPRLHRFARLLAHAHGGIWNASEAGAALGISYHTAQRYAEVLAQGFLVRFLPPWHANLGTRLVRRPKVYWRDTGLLHHHLGLDSPGGIRDHPKAGASWEGFVIEAILGRERAARPATEGFFFRTHAGLECDLLLDRGRERVAVEMKIGPPDRRDADRLRAVMKITGARRGIVVTRDGRSSSTGAGGRAGPVAVWRAEDLFQYRRR
jgi:predicted AAA+ superfamily ATPase